MVQSKTDIKWNGTLLEKKKSKEESENRKLNGLWYGVGLEKRKDEETGCNGLV